MDVYEITGLATGVDKSGVNYLQPIDSYQNLENGFINRQVLQSRQGVGYFAPRLAGNTRILGIFEHTLPNGTKELLAFDTMQLYKYNTVSGVFDPIPFGGSMAAYTGFAITGNDQYISGISYPTFDNQARFVFCGTGITPNLNGSAIFFYNGTSVQDFTDLGDNPKYGAPTLGKLVSAEFVLSFNQRLNFVIPTIVATAYNQGVLFSGIRDSSGNGDKFSVAGSGLFQTDTFQNITGASVLGSVIALNFDRMNYTLERTTDAFNPYFGREVPGPIGTNAKFSAVSWADAVKSLGKTGIIQTDGRSTLRIDNKIPNFTKEEIEQVEFNLTYGGFDRLNNLFLWAYKEDESTGDTQNKVLVNNYEEDSWSVYDQRFSVLGQTDIGLNLTWDDIDETAGNISWKQWDTTEDIWDRIGLGASVQKTLAGDDLGFIYEINKDFDDYISAISAITPGATTTITVTATGILSGDFVTIENVEGMTQINNFDPDTDEQIQANYLVLSATPTSIEINVDSTLFDPYTIGGTISKIIAFRAETIPFNPYRSIGRRCYVSHVEFLIDTNGGHLLVDVFSDEEDTAFRQNILLQPTDVQKEREWISMSVNQESNFLTFVLKQQSAAVQLRLTSMRIHARPGGYTSG